MPPSTWSGQSQQGIVIGRQGAKLKQIGEAARQAIEDLLGTNVFLKLFVPSAEKLDPGQQGATQVRVLMILVLPSLLRGRYQHPLCRQRSR